MELLYTIYFSTPNIRELSIVSSMSVCSFVCLPVREHISRTTRLVFSSMHFICIFISCGRDSVLLWRRCNTVLCTSALWMSSYLHIMGRVEACRRRCSEWRHCVALRRLTPLLRCFGSVVTRRAPRLDESIMQGVLGRCCVDWLNWLPLQTMTARWRCLSVRATPPICFTDTSDPTDTPTTYASFHLTNILILCLDVVTQGCAAVGQYAQRGQHASGLATCFRTLSWVTVRCVASCYCLWVQCALHFHTNVSTI